MSPLTTSLHPCSISKSSLKLSYSMAYVAKEVALLDHLIPCVLGGPVRLATQAIEWVEVSCCLHCQTVTVPAR